MAPMLVLLVTCATLLLGCDPSRPSEPDAPAPDGGTADPLAGTGGDPVALVGLWTVLGAGEEEGATLRLDETSLGLFRACGVIHGAWRATHEGLFVASSDGWSGQCGPDPRPPWLNAAAAHRPHGEGHLLLDASGETVARLVPGDVPAVPDTVSPTLAERPVVTDETRAALAPAAPLPDGLTPADTDSLLGTWLPDGAPSGSQAHLRFEAGGQWRGSDGCNSLGGRWRAGRGGALLGTTGVSTLIGCENLPVTEHVGSAARAGFDGDVLVLFDRSGDELGRYERGEPPSAP